MTPAATTPAARAAHQEAPAATAGSGGAARPGPPPARGQSHAAPPRARAGVSGPATAPAAVSVRAAVGPPLGGSPGRSCARRAAGPARSAGARVLAPRAAQLPDHALLDRLVRGRVWIPLLGVMLAGIVAMQVEVLKLGREHGPLDRAHHDAAEPQRAAAGQRRPLADDQRIERLAAKQGMVMPAPADVGFLPAGGGGDRRQRADLARSTRRRQRPSSPPRRQRTRRRSPPAPTSLSADPTRRPRARPRRHRGAARRSTGRRSDVRGHRRRSERRQRLRPPAHCRAHP